MELWSEVRRRVLTGELSKRQARKEYGLHWDTLQKILVTVHGVLSIVTPTGTPRR